MVQTSCPVDAYISETVVEQHSGVDGSTGTDLRELKHVFEDRTVLTCFFVQRRGDPGDVAVLEKADVIRRVEAEEFFFAGMVRPIYVQRSVELIVEDELVSHPDTMWLHWVALAVIEVPNLLVIEVGDSASVHIMAFRHSRVLQSVQQYHTRYSSPFIIDPTKTPYDPRRYGWQYTSKQIREGYERGRLWINRQDKTWVPNPLLENIQNEQRMLWVLWMLAVPIVILASARNKLGWDKDFYTNLFSQREFVGRYAYKTRDVEFQTPYDPTERGWS